MDDVTERRWFGATGGAGAWLALRLPCARRAARKRDAYADASGIDAAADENENESGNENRNDPAPAASHSSALQEGLTPNVSTTTPCHGAGGNTDTNTDTDTSTDTTPTTVPWYGSADHETDDIDDTPPTSTTDVHTPPQHGQDTAPESEPQPGTEPGTATKKPRTQPRHVPGQRPRTIKGRQLNRALGIPSASKRGRTPRRKNAKSSALSSSPAF